MKIDYQYISEILEVFIESSEPNVDINGFKQIWEDDENTFFFHILILIDKGIVAGAGRNSSDIGINFSSNTREYMVSVLPWRLTAEGNEFASALAKPSIKKVIIDKFKEEGFFAVIDISKKLATKQAEKLLSEVLN